MPGSAEMPRDQAPAGASDPAYLAALEWVARLNDETVSERERCDFSEWMAADPAHRGAFERATRLWNCFDQVKPAAERLQRRRALLGALAAVAALPAAYALYRQVWAADFRSGVGERRSVRLSDGSRVELGTDSAIAVAFSAVERRITLRRGQAFFEVAPDPARALSVYAGSGSTTALGTRFDIRRDGDTVTVSVLEHAVQVRADATPTARRVEQGWQLRYGGDGIGQPVRMIDPEAVVAWRQDRLVFDAVPLRQVLRELARYRHGPIVLMDRQAGSRPVTAVFDSRDIAGALHGLADALDLRLLDVGGCASFVYAGAGPAGR
ncbi:MAG: FecR domain-containing protein [Pseudomonas sp.]